ncbi:hypothetical protein BURMUCGD1_1182 [Burkholderia multivorans CGD1]|nr:hypothetical protein BURMUCGD1_1182 [Burkholderia multivorans CGD1]
MKLKRDAAGRDQRGHDGVGQKKGCEGVAHCTRGIRFR